MWHPLPRLSAQGAEVEATQRNAFPVLWCLAYCDSRRQGKLPFELVEIQDVSHSRPSMSTDPRSSERPETVNQLPHSSKSHYLPNEDGALARFESQNRVDLPRPQLRNQVFFVQQLIAIIQSLTVHVVSPQSCQ